MENLAQDYVIVKRSPEDPRVIVSGGGLVKTPGGALLAVVQFLPRHKAPYPNEIHRCRSEDGGETWAEIGEPLDWYEATPFVHDGAVYLMGHLPAERFRNKDIVLARSDDGGATWTKPVTLFDGPYWNTTTAMAERDGRLYRAVDRMDIPGRGLVVIAGNLSTGLLAPEHWRISEPVAYPGTPRELARGLYPPDPQRDIPPGMWLEPNVVNVNGSLRVLSRCNMDGKATSGVAAVSDITDDGDNLEVSFTQFHPFPGGQCKFSAIRDDVSGLFWTAVNIPTDSQDSFGRHAAWRERGFLGGPGNERRLLILQYSLDALNWFQAGCVASWDSPLRGFQYASPLIDGDDLLLLVRTSENGPNQHDADLMTFHCVRDFRSLALDLRGASLE